MRAIAKYLLFIGFLTSATYAAATFDARIQTPGEGVLTERAVASPLSSSPSYVLEGAGGVSHAHASFDGNSVAGCIPGGIAVWYLPQESPAKIVHTGEGFVASSLRFGKNIIVVAGQGADGTGVIRLYDAVSGGLARELKEPEPVVALDMDEKAEYLVATGLTAVRIWDLAQGQVVSSIPREDDAAFGYFYSGQRHVLQSSSLSVTDQQGTLLGTLDSAGPVIFRKTADGAGYAWLSERGLTVLHRVAGKKEIIPLDAAGVLSFDITPDRRWALFLHADRKIRVVDLHTGMAVDTVQLDFDPADIFMSADGSHVSVIASTGRIGVFTIGSGHLLRDIRHHTVKYYHRAMEKLEGLLPEPGARKAS